MSRQFDHAVLHDVQRSFFISDMVERSLESALFRVFEKI
jgi:hypothetical protein